MQNNFQTSNNGTGSTSSLTASADILIDVAETPQPAVSEADARYDIVLLDPKHIRLFRTGGPASALRLTLSDPQIGAPRSYLRVQVARAFPLSDPDHYIGLRDKDDKDIGLLETLDGLDADSRARVDEELYRRYFLPKIVRVNDVKEEFGMTTWDVETDKGHRNFVIRNLRDAVQELSATRVLVTDSDGNRYEFPDVRKLDDKSFAVMQRVL